MGKEGPETPQEDQKDEPKKIIKKVPFKMFGRNKKGDLDDGLKDWKPMKIVDTVEQQKKELQK